VVMKLSELKNHDQVVRERQESDPEYATESDRLALASAVSLAVVHHRGEHRLTQTGFGRLLGWSQLQVARLECGDIPPSIENLERLASAGIIDNGQAPGADS
jgi:hypothetical protein